MGQPASQREEFAQVEQRTDTVPCYFCDAPVWVGAFQVNHDTPLCSACNKSHYN